ncbi:MAG: hypothetical protein HKO95_17575 [Rhodobacteraceae bacterium]|nr:hypothetical protein [Alphaproteobacteria bacterium]NNF72451.1 hypothetical protein [Paracoccaceae bacterium]NNK68537.1 hypothetical protein [Paracoccaceae bacterium]
MSVGLLPIGRSTFDVAFAEARLAAMRDRLASSGIETVGPENLVLDADAARAAIADIVAAGAESILILQVTFTDAVVTVEAAETGLPVSIWALPEPREGARLRLNAFCGLNLASHALGLRGLDFGWAYANPEEIGERDLACLLSGTSETARPHASKGERTTPEAKRIVEAISGRRIARIGEHPEGFDTCAYDAERLKALAGVEVDVIALDDLFSQARGIEPEKVARIRADAAAAVDGLDTLDQDQLDRSLRLKAALERIFESANYSAAAIRCWPETFTEYGGALCAPAGMMAASKRPCACEVDVYGALTQMVLQEASGGHVFLTDLVDIDAADNSAVVWHCGQAPISMRDPDASATATIHTNRKMPLLYEFPLKPGAVTLMRISQAQGAPKMVLAGAEMLKRPMAFTGTSGVLRFERPAQDVLNDVIAIGLEHHLAIAYGDHRARLREVAAAMDLPVLEL